MEKALQLPLHFTKTLTKAPVLLINDNHSQSTADDNNTNHHCCSTRLAVGDEAGH